MDNRCCLCGGKIRAGRCTECGMPFQKSSARTFTEDNGPKTGRRTGEAERLPKEKKAKKKSVSSYDYGGSGGSKTGQPLKPQKKNRAAGLVALLSVGITAAGIALPAVNYFTDNDSSYEYEDDSYDYDPYADIDEELPAGEEQWSATLEPGFYEVGVQIPVGEYKVTATEGSGPLRLTNNDIGLYVSEYMNADSSNEDEGVTEMDGLLCYEGSILQIEQSLTVNLDTGTAVADTAEYVSNERTQSYNFDDSEAEDGEMVLISGEDFTPGFYDFTTDEENASFFINLEEYSFDFEILDSTKGVHNVYLPEGAEVNICGSVTLTPSQEIGADWDENFYDKIN